MGEAGFLLSGLPRDLAHEDEIEEEVVIMATSSPDRPPGEVRENDGELDLNCSNDNEQSNESKQQKQQQQGHQVESREAATATAAALQDDHCTDEELTRKSTRNDSQPATESIDNSSRLDDDREAGWLEDSAPSHEEKGRCGRKTRWDPAPAKQAELNSSDINSRLPHRSFPSNGFPEQDDLRHRRYSSSGNDNKRCVTIQPNFRKDNYYRNDGGFEQQLHKSSYARAGSSIYDRGPHRFGGTRNGFERRVDWCSSSSSSRRVQEVSPRTVQDFSTSRDRRDWSGGGRLDRESYGRRSEREVFEVRDRRDWIRNMDRDRRQTRNSEEWHSGEGYRGNQWQAATSSVVDTPRSQGGFSAYQASEGPVYPVTPVGHSTPSDATQAPVQSSSAEQAIHSHGASAKVGVEEEEQEAGQLPDETYEPGEVKTSKGWVYVNDNGDVQGPMELAALKLLASNGFMPEDHLVSRAGTNAWITLEHAQSPDVGAVNYSRLTDPAVPARAEKEICVPKTPTQPKHHKDHSSCCDIDGRIDRIMMNYPAKSGDELKKAVLAALDTQRFYSIDASFDFGSPRRFCDPWRDTAFELGLGLDVDLQALHANAPRNLTVEESAPPPPSLEPPPMSDNSSPLKWVPGKWITKGGDWKLVHPEGQNYVKVVLNDGSLLLSELKHHGADPRRHVQDSETGKGKIFELPQWAVERSQKTDLNAAETSARAKSTTAPSPSPAKPSSTKVGAKNLVTKPPDEIKPVLPKKVDARAERSKGPDKHISSAANTALERFPVKAPKQVARFADIKAKCHLDLGRGDWFYKDGGGSERGPCSFTELQSMVSKELLTQGTSVYRKSDDTWVPLPSEVADGDFSITEVATSSFDGARRVRKVITTNIQQTIMGFTSGQLHEHVMKHYKNQVMSAILFEGLDARLKLIESTKKLSEVEILSNDDSLRYHPSPSSSDSDEILREEGEQEHRIPRRPFRGFKSNGNHVQTTKKRHLDDSESDIDESEGSDSVTQEGSNDSQRKMKSLKSIGSSGAKDEEDVDESRRAAKDEEDVIGVRDEEDVDEAEPMEIDPCYSNDQDLESMTQHSGFKRVKLNTGAKAIKENGYSKGKRTCERKTVVTKKINKLSSLQRRSVKLEEETASTWNQLVDACDVLTREWGARMTKAAMVPPVTRKYEVIDEYWVVIDKELVERKMRVEIPDDYEEKLRLSKQKRGGEYSHLDIPEIKEYQPRRELGDEVLEQEVYGVDPYTHNLLLDTMPPQPTFSQSEKLQFMEENLLQAINKEVKQFTGTGKAPIEYPLEPVFQRMVDEAEESGDSTMQEFCQGLLDNMRIRTKEKYVAYRKGLGVVCNRNGGFREDDFVVEFLGEVYPAWRWYEKQDGCRFLQKKDKDPAPEFYNIYLERPKGDAAGYDLVIVDAMHKANFASRICHSCRPNCEAKVTAVNNRYIIGVYALRPIQNGEELTFDYNSLTESKEEYNNSICLCGSQCCRGSYLNLANAGASEEVIKECHGLLDRHALLLEACCEGSVTRLELEEMRQAGVGSCLLDGLPDWLLKYTARLVEFMNLERQRLPDELMKSAKKRKKDEYSYELCRADAENQAEGVYNGRLQNIAITLDKVRYVLRQLFTDPREAPPLLKKLDQKEIVSRLWSAENSVVNDLLNCMTPHMFPDKLAELKRQVREHTPAEKTSLRESLLWLRDTLRTLEPTLLSRHDAAADLVQMYAYTQCFFTCEEYGTFDSPPIEISALDLGRHVNTSASYTWKKTYNKEYVLGQLMSWFKQSIADPGASLVQARRGCLVLPDFSSCYAKGLQQDSRRAYGSRIREEMFPRMERCPQKQWPKSQFWEFKSNRGLFGSPMLDAVQRGGHPDVEMMHWLKTRAVNFVGPYDH